MVLSFKENYHAEFGKVIARLNIQYFEDVSFVLFSSEVICYLDVFPSIVDFVVFPQVVCSFVIGVEQRLSV